MGKTRNEKDFGFEIWDLQISFSSYDFFLTDVGIISATVVIELFRLVAHGLGKGDNV